MTKNHFRSPAFYPGCLILVLCLYTACLSLNAQDPPTAEIRVQMEELLEVLADYEFDKSRSWMPELQKLMMEIYHNSEAVDEVEPLMTGFLESDATPAGKQYVCRELGIMGTARAVPALSALLYVPGMSATALLALEKVPGTEADKALLKALEKGDTRLQTACANALSARRVSGAVPALGKLLQSENEQLVLTAISGLGNIGGKESVRILQDFSDKAPANLKWAVLDARLACADRMLKDGGVEEAAWIFAGIYQADAPPTLKYNALAGLFRTTREDPYTFIRNHLSQADPAFHPYIMQLVYQLDGSHRLGRLFDDLPGTMPVPKLHLFASLASIGDATVRPHVIAALDNNDEPTDVRKAALRAMASIGEPEDAILLAELAASSRGPEKELARQSLYLLPGQATNETIGSGIRDQAGGIKAELIRSAGERNMTGTTRLLFEYTADPDRNIRLESIRALGRLASPEALPDLISVLMQTDNRRDRQEAERAVFAVTQKMPADADRSAGLVKAMDKTTDPDALSSLINVIGMIGDGKDLDVLRAHLESEDDRIQLAVIRALSGWPDAGPMKDLKQLAIAAEDQRKHTLALRGYMDVVLADGQMSEDDKFSEIRQAYDLAASASESRMVISGLSRLGSLAALDMAIELLDDPDVKKEAEAAVARIAQQTGWEFPRETTKRLKALQGKIENEDVLERIHRILERIN